MDDSGGCDKEEGGAREAIRGHVGHQFEMPQDEDSDGVWNDWPGARGEGTEQSVTPLHLKEPINT